MAERRNPKWGLHIPFPQDHISFEVPNQYSGTGTKTCGQVSRNPFLCAPSSCCYPLVVLVWEICVCVGVVVLGSSQLALGAIPWISAQTCPASKACVQPVCTLSETLRFWEGSTAQDFHHPPAPYRLPKHPLFFYLKVPWWRFSPLQPAHSPRLFPPAQPDKGGKDSLPVNRGWEAHESEKVSPILPHPQTSVPAKRDIGYLGKVHDREY